MKSFAEVFMIGLRYLKKKIKEKDRNAMLVVAIPFLSYLLLNQFILWNDLENNKEYTIGVIYGTGFKGKGTEVYLCEFYVKGEKYLTFESKGLSKIVVGDSALIKYDRNNPHNNEIAIYFEYTLDRSKLPDSVFYRRPMSRMRKPLE